MKFKSVRLRTQYLFTITYYLSAAADGRPILSLSRIHRADMACEAATASSSQRLLNSFSA